MQADDWVPALIEPGKYSNAEPLVGFRRRDGQGGNPLHPARGQDEFEVELERHLKAFGEIWPGAIAERCFVRLPYWTGLVLPRSEDYRSVGQPEPLTTTSISVVLVPNGPAVGAGMGFHFQGRNLPTLRARTEGAGFQGLVGNLGYFMTEALIQGYRWSHNERFPDFPVPRMPSYIGFHLFHDEPTGELFSSFQGGYPGVVGICHDGTVEILPRVAVDKYEVAFEGRKPVRFAVDSIDTVEPVADVMLFTRGFRGTEEIQGLIALAETSAGRDKRWQTCKPMIPVAVHGDRVNLFVANRGNGRVPVERVVSVWEGAAPLPSFGAVLSFGRACFESLFGGVEKFRVDYAGQRVRVLPTGGDVDVAAYAQMMGGLVPAVVDGVHVYGVGGTIGAVMKALTRQDATSPITQSGQETRNFDPRIREPAGVLVQTERRVGWVLFDGRHELSIGASVVDVAILLRKLEDEGVLGGRIQQAVFVDGGSAMKAYYVRSGYGRLRLDLLNRVAAGSRNGPGSDPDGRNLYAVLRLQPARGEAGPTGASTAGS
jgi:hypothetical protein